jgi:hypothetical protein
MTEITQPFHLYAPRLSPDSPVQADLLPPEVAGQPATYFWKDAIHAGAYRHPTRGFSLAVDRHRLHRWADVGSAMLDAGVPIPINCDHSDSARDVVGYVREFKVDGDHLFALCQFIGPDAALTAARNHVSVGIHPDFTDGQGRRWGEAIIHLALTPVPVVPGQRGFIAAAQDPKQDHLLLALEVTSHPRQIACTEDQWQSLCDLLGNDLSVDDCFDRLLARFQDESAADESLQAELSAARAQVLELSAKVPAPLTPEMEEILAESIAAKLDSAVAAGSLAPGARDRLFAALIAPRDGQSPLLTLSGGTSGNRTPPGNRPLALSIAEILHDNPPISLGETTELQALSRPIPGDEPSGNDQLRDYMTRIASV